MRNLLIFFLGIYLFGFFIEGFSFIKYIGLYGAILFFLIDLFLYKNILTLKKVFVENKYLFFSFFVLLITIILSIIFAYSDLRPSLKEFRVEFLNIGIFMLISLWIEDKKLLFKVFFYSLILAFCFDVFKFAYMYYLSNPELNWSIRLNRSFSNYFEILYPFILASIFIIRNKFKYIVIIFLLFAFFELILTGARGAWIEVLIETIIFLLYLERKYFKKFLYYIIGGLFIIIFVGLYFYKYSSLFQQKINQGLSPNGRDVIVETRLPIFIKHGNFLLGIGGPGNYQYNKFLNDYNAPKMYGLSKEKEFFYWADEPFLLQIFYKEGILGLMSFLFFSGMFLLIMFKYLKINYSIEYKLFIVSIISSYVGYYFIRGLVEGRNFKYILVYLTLFLIIKESTNENSIHLS
ncbi:hypothetical protein JCM15786_14840 [Nautilia lithotrophica]